ncbi:flagellar biosynthesis protein FlhB [Pantoea alhagi]|nr:flagellar biosynthesis protein FlhB [Pantoea alhagi]
MINYLKLLVYSCVFCCIVYFLLGGGVSLIIYLTKGYFFYSLEQVKRTVFFGSVSGIAITLAAIVFRSIDKYKNLKTPPSDSE